MKAKVYKLGISWVVELPETPKCFYYWAKWEHAIKFALTREIPVEASFLVPPNSIWMVSEVK